MQKQASVALGESFIKFINSSRTAFHAVETTKNKLSSLGFQELSEKNPWTVNPGGKYWFTRNQSSIVAFTIGQKWKNGNGFNMVGAHTDSPCLKVKPQSNKSNYGYLQVGVETYGGGLWYTWFDRDLTVGGRVIVKNGESYESRLVYIPRPIMRIPSLAIHLDRTVNEQGFKFNAETATLPVLETAIKAALSTPGEATHNAAFIGLIAQTLDVKVEDIVNFELSLCDTQDAVIGGINNEFIFSGRLDNLMSSFCAIEALCLAATEESLAEEENVRMVCLFDHEEIGSQSAYGAASPIVYDSMLRISESLAKGTPVDMFLTKNKSFMISADMAHAIHPNFGEKHENNHRPYMHKGPVIKFNANQRYATSSETSLVIEHFATANGIPIQKFVVRNDAPCGSTIGPILSSELGVRTVDIGNPQLSMHSIREMCGVDDTYYCVQLCKAFFEGFAALNKNLKID